MNATTSERYGDPLPDGAPAGLTSCKQYTDWYALWAGDTLPADAADALMALRLSCGLDEALQKGGATEGELVTDAKASHPKISAISAWKSSTVLLQALRKVLVF